MFVHFLIFLLSYGAVISDKCSNNDLRHDISSHSHSSSSSSKLSPIPTWAIICLVRSQDSLQYNKRNSAIAQALLPFSKSHKMTFLFFSEDTFPPTTLQEWRDQFRDIGEVQLIDVSSKAYHMPPPLPHYGYKWMCKFFTVDLYEYLLPYDYYLRIDSDNVVISSPLSSSQQIFTYDFMSYVEENEIEYGYVIRKYEPHQETRQTLPAFIESYIDKCELKPKIPRPSFDLLFNFYNNFHVGKVSFFTQPHVRHFMVATNTSGQLYQYRWGDSTIQAAAVRLFMSPYKVKQLPNITYRHISHSNKLVTSDLSLADRPIEIPQVFPDFVISSTGQRVRGDWTQDPALSDISIVKKGPLVHSGQGHQQKKAKSPPTPPSETNR